jgi:hypothetical protein
MTSHLQFTQTLTNLALQFILFKSLRLLSSFDILILSPADLTGFVVRRIHHNLRVDKDISQARCRGNLSGFLPFPHHLNDLLDLLLINLDQLPVAFDKGALALDAAAGFGI